MAEVLGLTSSLLAVVQYAYQASDGLSQSIKSFGSSKRQIRQLQEELDALSTALQSLSENLHGDPDGLAMLKLPLLRCGHACGEFENLIAKSTAHFKAARTSFHDWGQLRYMGNDIDGFRHTLTGYKSTIDIAVGGLTLRRFAVTKDALASYLKLVSDTQEDLQDHLQDITEQLRTVRTRSTHSTHENATKERQILEERESTKTCLEICAKISERVSQVRPLLVDSRAVTSADSSTAVSIADALPASRTLTTHLLDSLQDRTNAATFSLRARHDRLEALLASLSVASGSMTSAASSAASAAAAAAEQQRVEEELRSIERSLEICASAARQARAARTNVFEDVNAAEDANQVLVSTLGDLVSARRVTASKGSFQLLGQLGDTSVQQLSRDRVAVAEIAATAAREAREARGARKAGDRE